MGYFSLAICVSYGLISILQTLNAKLLFKILNFNYSSFVFIIERLINIVVIIALRNNPINWHHLKLTIPFSLLMCTTNLLTSFCITVMPLESFISFKKFLILFVLLCSMASTWLLTRGKSQPLNGLVPTKVQLPYYKILAVLLIVIGGIMIGFYTKGTVLGYSSSMASNIMEALSLQYCSYLSIYHGVSPSGLLLYNSILSLPYYMGVMLYERELADISAYISDPPGWFAISLCVMIVLGSLSELTANLITMWISPFEKATVSNIKDLLILAISVQFFHEMELCGMNEAGIFLCLVGSGLFSLPALMSKSGPPDNAYDPVLQSTRKFPPIITQTDNQNSALLNHSEMIEPSSPTAILPLSDPDTQDIIVQSPKCSPHKKDIIQYSALPEQALNEEVEESKFEQPAE